MASQQLVIVLSKTEYGDNSLIIDLYSLQNGRMTASSYSSRKRKSRFYFEPFSLLELEIYQSKKAKFNRIKEARSALPLQMMIHDPEVNAMRYFLAEVLKKTLVAEENDPALFSFLKVEIENLYLSKNRSQFLINFMERLSPYLGIDFSEIQKIGGKASDYDMSFSESEWNSLMNNNFKNYKQRLKLILKFYAHHFEGMEKLKSKEILAEVFN